jgi:hypothetical protein
MSKSCSHPQVSYTNSILSLNKLNPRRPVSHVTQILQITVPTWLQPTRPARLGANLYVTIRQRIFLWWTVSAVTYSLWERGAGAHPVVAGESGGAVLRSPEPGRAELLPAHVRETCKAATDEKLVVIRDAQKRTQIGAASQRGRIKEAVKAIRLMPRR